MVLVIFFFFFQVWEANIISPFKYMQVWLDLGFSFRKEKKNQETYEHVKVEGERWGLY